MRSDLHRALIVMVMATWLGGAAPARADEDVIATWGTQPITAAEITGAFSNGPIASMRIVEQRLVADTIARASSLRNKAIFTASGVGAAVLIVLLLALLLTTVVGRSMVRPLRRLRSGALEVAGVRLPETVRRMSDSDGAGAQLEIDPIDVDSGAANDEISRQAAELLAAAG